MKNNKHSKWTLSYGAIGGVVGLTLAQIDRLSFGAGLGIISGALVIIIISLIYVRKKSDQTPEFDERIINNIKKLYFYSNFVLIITLFILVGTLVIMDIEYISTLTLLLIIFIYAFITGIITMVISKR